MNRLRILSAARPAKASGRIMNIPLPRHRLATRPPEARGLARDAVRLLISHYLPQTLELSERADLQHGVFTDIGAALNAGDVLVINTSGTLPAALDAQHADGRTLRLHFSTHLAEEDSDLTRWSVEVRRPDGKGTSRPFAAVAAGDRLRLPEGVSLELIRPLSGGEQPRLWETRIIGEAWQADWLAYLHRHGRAIRYDYVAQDWPLAAYQTVFATEPGSAEMPSAGRAFTPELLTRLLARGVQIVPVLLHTGVSSQESHEAPYPEFYRVPESSARVIRAARAAGSRIVAVGTTVVRALESAWEDQGRLIGSSGWTRLMITPARGMRVVTGLLTGFHEPEATHLAMLAALAGEDHLRLAYAAALEQDYLWHEFGDLHLILP